MNNEPTDPRIGLLTSLGYTSMAAHATSLPCTREAGGYCLTCGLPDDPRVPYQAIGRLERLAAGDTHE